MTVRRAGPNDLTAVVAMERASFTQPWSYHSFAELVEAKPVVFLVAEAGGELAGYAVLYHAGGESELANLAVAAYRQRQGIGRQLLDAILDAARAHGAREMFLEVRASNEAAERLYAAAGFVPVARRRRYYEEPIEDAIVMRRAIEPAAPIAS